MQCSIILYSSSSPPLLSLSIIQGRPPQSYILLRTPRTFFTNCTPAVNLMQLQLGDFYDRHEVTEEVNTSQGKWLIIYLYLRISYLLHRAHSHIDNKYEILSYKMVNNLIVKNFLSITYVAMSCNINIYIPAIM